VSPLKNFGCGQFTESGAGYGWSLGCGGGYEVWHIPTGFSEITIKGNAFNNWNEPGIVWVQEDKNSNGLPDETWYELRGSEDDNGAYRSMISRRYAMQYFNANSEGKVNEYGQTIRAVYWFDAKGRGGLIPGGWPRDWGVTGDRVTYTFTLLRDDAIFGRSSPSMIPDEFIGYVDTVGRNRFYITDAIKADGAFASLGPAKFVKVQTALFVYGGAVGDISTEVTLGDYINDQTGGFPMPED
jgi:hypothetical protein